MKLLALLLPLSAVYSRTLTYDADISSFAITYTDGGSGTVATFTDWTDGFLTDGDKVAKKVIPYVTGGQWANGIVGDFQANVGVPSSGLHWDITNAEIYFSAGDDCKLDSATASYTDLNGNNVDLGTATKDDVDINGNTVTKFTANIVSSIQTKGSITFRASRPGVCEGNVAITEYVLEGTEVTSQPTTSRPTERPTERPTTPSPTTPSPTTSMPTPKPTTTTPPPSTRTPTSPQHDCMGMFTFGDPHYLIMAGGGERHDRSTSGSLYKQYRKFDYQGSGWHYYYAPCDLSEYETWPFFLLSKHDRWKKGRSATTIQGNRLVLNTKPNAYVIEYSDDKVTVYPGSGASSSKEEKYKSKALRRLTSSNYLAIDYDDNQGQSGQVRIYKDSSSKVVLEIRDLSRANCGDQLVMTITAHDSWLVYTCPECMYGQACGLMGKYIRGDCTKAEFNDPNSECHHVLVGSDGEIYNNAKVNRVGKDLDNKAFVPFAKTWAIDEVHKNLENIHGITDWAGDHQTWPAASFSKNRNFGAMTEGRAIDIDFTVFEGNCTNNPARVLALNGTCNEHTWGKYQDCCEKIGYCDMLWESCIFDMCYCPEDEQEDCLNGLIHATLNDTCSYKRFFPQATRDPNLKEGLDRLDGIGTVPIILISIAVLIGVCVFGYSICRWAMSKRDERNRYQLEQENLQMDGGDTNTYDMSPLDAR